MTKVLWRETFKLWGFTLNKIPLIFWVKPKIMEISADKAVIVIPFKRRTQNHVKSMYFGALCVGADLAPGLLTMRLLEKETVKCVFLFKDFSAEFLKRVEDDATFTCSQGKAISEAIGKAIMTRERQNVTLDVEATVPAKVAGSIEVVARFKMTISIKAREQAAG